MRPSFTRPVLAASAIAVSLTLGACGNRHHIEVGSVPDDYRTRHPIVVSQADQALDIPVVSSDRELAMPDAGRIEDFAKRFRHSGADMLRVMIPYGSANGAAAAHVSHEAIGVLVRAGVPRNQILVESYAAHDAVRATPIRFTFATLTAKTGPCGRWPEDLTRTHENKNYYNFGCAYQQNLAAQIADPRDLLSPRGMGPVDGERRDQVFEQYRQGQVTSSEDADTISEY